MVFKTYHFKSISSTQDKAKEFASKGLENIAVISDVQTKARGRFKRKWHSSRGGLWMSILVKPGNMGKMQYLTFCAAIAAADSIKKLSKLNVKIKWPNDVHYNRKKLCGILTEGHFGKNDYAIIGIGINTNQTKFSNDIKNTAASIKSITHKNTDIKKLSQIITTNFFNLYNNYYCKNKFEEIMQKWKSNSDTIGKKVKVITTKKTFIGNVINIDEDCNLIIKYKNKKNKIVE